MLTDFNNQKENALKQFRNKDYSSSRDRYQALIKMDEYNDIDYTARSTILNGLLVSIYHLFQMDTSNLKLIDEFESYIKLYFVNATNTTADEKSKWADNIIANLLDYAFEITLSKNCSFQLNAHSPLGEIQENIRLQIRNYLDQFIDIFHSQHMSHTFFYNILLTTILKERHNFERMGLPFQFARNTFWLSLIYLDKTKGNPECFKSRSGIMDILADLVFFYNMSDANLQYEPEKEAIKWLELSLKEYPDNKFADMRIKELRKILTTRQQINRFMHDTASKISSAREKINMVLEKVFQSDELFKLVIDLQNYLNTIYYSYRLTNKLSPKIDKVELCSVLKQLDNFFPSAIRLRGFESNPQIETDADYLMMVMQNLIKNSIEAYKRNGIKPPFPAVEISFNPEELSIQIKDWAGGIPDEFLVRNSLFDPFVSSKGVYQDCGLGLAIVYQTVVELLKYKIDVYNYTENEQVIGAIFKITIKLPEDD